MQEFNEIQNLLKFAANAGRAGEMKAYMRDQFEFYGIRSPERKAIIKPFLRRLKKTEHPTEEFVMLCYKSPYRECHYLAMDYMFHFRSKLIDESMPLIQKMITQHSWWDTVDFIASNIVGDLVKRYPRLKDDVLQPWSTSGNMWLRRTSLLFQLKYREETDHEFLEKAIMANLGSNEFFINKAIGWALRQYSKTNPEWVRKFVEQKDLQPLSRREAIKFI